MSRSGLTPEEDAQLENEVDELLVTMKHEEEAKAKFEKWSKENAEYNAFEKSASEKYVANYGICPVCEKDDCIHGESYEPEDGGIYASRDCSCSHCGSSWKEALKVTEIFSIRKGDLLS